MSLGAGDAEFVPDLRARSLPAYQLLAQQQSGEALQLESYSSDIVPSTSKFTTELSLGLGIELAQEPQAG